MECPRLEKLARSRQGPHFTSAQSLQCPLERQSKGKQDRQAKQAAYHLGVPRDNRSDAVHVHIKQELVEHQASKFTCFLGPPPNYKVEMMEPELIFTVDATTAG
eukprot:1157826-Pelagomonas_calceolata.AAC.6